MDVYMRPRNRFVAGFIGSPPMNFVTGRLEHVDGTLRFAGGGLQAEIRSAEAAAAELSGERPVVLGVRPEHVRLGAQETAAGTARVSVVESLGDASLVHLALAEADEDPQNDQKMFVSKTEANTRVKPGDVVGVAVDGQHAHLFDSQTGENLTRSPQ